MRRFFTFLAAIIIIGAIVWVMGPRTPVDTQIRIDAAAIAADPEGWIARSEANIASINPGTTKEIIWAFPASRAKTPIAIVYVHGFSATKQETRPLPDDIAKALGANLYYARLTGHGQSGEALANATVNDWVNDMAEALVIGKAIGERVVVIATSTGGSLAAWSASRPELAAQMDALVLISPNFALMADGSFLLTQPWAGQIANLIIGDHREFETSSPEHAKFWTWSYPTRALLPMAEAVKLARDASAERMKTPALFIYSPSDTVVDESVTAGIASRWGAPHESIEVTNSDDPNNHVIAGAILSPGTTADLTAKTIAWIKGLNL